MKKVAGLLVLLVLMIPPILMADDREEPIDVIIALDKSKSMAETPFGRQKIEGVKEYVKEYLIDRLLIPGDFFLAVAFYGKTEVPIAMNIRGEEDKQKAKEIISNLLADGPMTDIGNALDVLGSEVDKRGHPDRQKYLLLITDGEQNAPKDSKYYSPDGSFNHEFLKNTKVIQRKGWKVHVLGIGTYQAAQELAQELGGKFTGISEEPTAKRMAEITKDFLATLELADGIKVSGINRRGAGRLSLAVESKGYEEEKQIVVSAIELSVPELDLSLENILPKPHSFTVEPGTTQSTRIPVRLPSELESGDYKGEIQFFFSSEDHFIPVVMQTGFHVKSFLENYWYWMLAGVILLALLAVGAVLLISNLFRNKVRFRLLVDGREEEQVILREGKALFLVEEENRVSLADTRTPNSLAKLNVFGNGLRMFMLKPDRFPKLQEVPRDVIDFDFRIRSQSGKNINVGFGSIT